MPESAVARALLLGMVLAAPAAVAEGAGEPDAAQGASESGGLPFLSYAPDFPPQEWPGIDTRVDPEHLPEEDLLAPEPPDGFMDRGFDYLVKQHKSISTRVDVMGRAIDRYLAGDRAMAEDNETYMKVQLSQRWIEQGEWESDNDLKFRLDLPATKRRYRVVLNYRPDFEGESLEQRTLPSSQVQSTSEDKSLFAGAVRTMKDEAERWEGRMQAGIKVRWPLDPFVRLNSRREFALGSEWSLTSRNEASWFAEDGFSANQSLAFDRALSTNLLFRSTSSVQWREEEDTLEMGQVLDLFHQLDDRRLLDYQVGVLGNSYSNPQVNIYYISLIYRQDLYRRWLYLNVVPQLAYLREDEPWNQSNDYDDELSLLVGIEVFFNQF